MRVKGVDACHWAGWIMHRIMVGARSKAWMLARCSKPRRHAEHRQIRLAHLTRDSAFGAFPGKVEPSNARFGDLAIRRKSRAHRPFFVARLSFKKSPK